jgi:hypothetical protein
MIFTRIKRGATRTCVLLNQKIGLYQANHQAENRAFRFTRSGLLTLLAIRTVVLPIPVGAPVAASYAMPEESEPPSTQRIAASAVDALTFTGIATPGATLLPIRVTERSLQAVKVGKSVAQVQADEAEVIRLQSQAAVVSAKKKRVVAVAAARPVIAAGTVQEIAYRHTIASFGEEHWLPMQALITRESGFNPYARNARSGAFGLGQALPATKMAPYGADYLTNPDTQMRWMISYVKSRYGTPANAWSFWQQHRWY